MKKGITIPVHSHPHEQTGWGHCIFIIDGERFDTRPGDTWNIPSNIENSAEVIEESIVVETFYPVSDNYL